MVTMDLIRLGAKLRIAIGLSALILVAELVGGYLANSLALLSDAGHIFTDIMALTLSWYGVRQAARPANAYMTYGYHRVGILVALINAGTLVLIALAIFYEAYRRLHNPEPVAGAIMLPIATIGLIVNAIVATMLWRDQRGNINVRSAFLHVLGDALASGSVIAGGIVILLTGRYWIDPLLSVLIALILIVGSVRIIIEAVNIVLEASPRGLDVEHVIRSIAQVPGVKDVHDLHVWTIAPQMPLLSCHVMVEDLPVSQASQTLININELLKNKFNITHSTVQLECEGSDPNYPYCTLSAEVSPRAEPLLRP